MEIAPRIITGVNWIGLATLAKKEIARFMNVYLQTIAAPVITTLLYYAVFSLAFGGAGQGSDGHMVNGVPYMTFLIPGLIMMSMSQNAFSNTSSSIIIAKVQGNIVDVLMPPLSAGELLAGYMLGALVRGVAVGAVSIAFLLPVAHLPLEHAWAVVVFGVLGTVVLGLLGVIGGIWSEKFDHIAAVTNFIVMPLTMLSGTFYSIGQMTQGWQTLAHLNPFFYMIDGFRFGFIGAADMPVGIGIACLSTLAVVLWFVSWRMLASGYKIKS